MYPSTLLRAHSFLLVALTMLASCSSVLGIERLQEGEGLNGDEPVISAFSFRAADHAALAVDVNATIDDASIAVVIPFGMPVTSLKASFQTTGVTVTVSGATQISGVSANDFTNPVVYRVTAQDGSTKDYTVSVGVAPSNQKALTSFAFLATNVPGLATDVTATIMGTTIVATMPYGTNPTALKATFQTTGTMVTVNGTTQVSGVTPNDFSSSVVYRVTAADGSTTDYAVTISVAPSGMKDLTSFVFLAANNPGLSVDVTGLIVGTTITATFPTGTSITALKPSFQSTGVTVSVGGVTQTSGVSANNFTIPVPYRVTAANNSTKDYTVMASVTASSSKDLTSFAFLAGGNPGLTADVPGAVGSTTITATVPNGTSVTALKASFGTTGMSVSVGGVTQVSGATATNFTNPVVFRVTAADSSTKDYTVTVTVAAPGPSFVSGQFGTGTNPRSVAVADLNGDGRTDFAAVNETANTVSVVLNTGAPGTTTPTFGFKADFATGLSPRSIAVADLNGDGWPDLAITNSMASTVSVLLNTAAGGATTPSFAAKVDFTVGTGATSVAMSDFNSDAKPDLAIANTTSNNVSVLLNTMAGGASTPSFAPVVNFTTGASPTSVAAGDLNADGRADLIVANDGAMGISVLLNTTVIAATTPTFAARQDFSTGLAPVSVAIDDFNADGRPDVAVANSTPNTVAVLLNTMALVSPTPTFAASVTFATGAGPQSITRGDYNGDGRPDLVVANANGNTVSLLLNTTAQGAAAPDFAAKVDFPTAMLPSGIASGDFNGDHKLDLAIANAASNTVSVLLNSSTWGRPFVFDGGVSVGAASGGIIEFVDLNLDGKLDVVLGESGMNEITLLLNTKAPTATMPSFATPIEVYSGGMAGLAIADYNLDGRPDLATANIGQAMLTVYLNTTAVGSAALSLAPDATFVTGVNPQGIVAADLNGDFKPDLITSNRTDSTVSVLLNTTPPGATAPTFAPKADFATGSEPFRVTVGDLNGDFAPDIVVTTPGSSSVSILFNTTVAGASTAAFAPNVQVANGVTSFFVAIGDFNADGKGDLVVSRPGQNLLSVLVNTTVAGAPTPTFGPRLDIQGTSQMVEIADFNGDGRNDLAIAGGLGTYLYAGTTSPGATTASFATPVFFLTATSNPVAIASGDVSGDGEPDLGFAYSTFGVSPTIMFAK